MYLLDDSASRVNPNIRACVLQPYRLAECPIKERHALEALRKAARRAHRGRAVACGRESQFLQRLEECGPLRFHRNRYYLALTIAAEVDYLGTPCWHL